MSSIQCRSILYTWIYIHIFIRIDVLELIGLIRIDFWLFFIKRDTKRFLDWFGMIPIDSDTDIGIVLIDSEWISIRYFRQGNDHQMCYLKINWYVDWIVMMLIFPDLKYMYIVIILHSKRLRVENLHSSISQNYKIIQLFNLFLLICVISLWTTFK